MAVTGGHASAAQNAAATRPVAPHAGSTYTVLHNFSGPPNDGDYPTAEPTLDTSGNIYGVTDYGGANSAGALFEITSGGTESVIHSFGAAGDGTYPDGAVIFDANGNMYGTTEDGGASDNGTVWELAADGTYSVLHSFASTEGNFIRGRLVQDKQGNLYGTALFGGANGDGSVFECSTSGKLTVLYSFGGTDGQYPEHGVVVDKKGNLYGATAFGGANDDGSVYKISRKGSFTSLYSFTGGSDGSFLYGGLAIGRKGKLYGSAASNGAGNNGTVFKMTPTGTLTTLYSFTGGSDGGSPEGDMLVVGKKLYSAANYGGADGYGVVYEVTPKGKETVLESFTNANGAAYSAGMTASGKTLYGTAGGGGTDGFGVVFSVTKK
jgi:uncharacterized repeat protein (TIGR03803 family)